MGKSSSDPDYYSDQEATHRREATLQRMLRTPPKPHKKHSKAAGAKSKKTARRRRLLGMEID